MQRWRDGVLVCQGKGRLYGRLFPRQGICARLVTKVGRYKIVGGWHDVYECDQGHRFGVRGVDSGVGMRSDLTVVDIATEKPVFGDESLF